MSHQAFLAMLVHGMALPNATQAVPHQELIKCSGKQRSRYVDKYGDGTVVHVREGLAAIKDGGHDPRPQVAGHVGGDGDVGEPPHHDAVRQADGEGGGRGRDEGVRRVDARPDDYPDERIDEELGQEHVAHVRLRRVRERAENAGRRAVGDERLACGTQGFVHGLDLGPIHAHHEETGHERPEDLRENVICDVSKISTYYFRRMLESK